MVCLVEAAPGTPAKVTDIPVTAGRRLRTLRGTVAELAALAETVGDDFLRVWVREPARAGLREEVSALLPNALEVRIDPEFAAPVAASRPSSGTERTPSELFREYLGTRSVADPRVEQLFARLHDHVTGGELTCGPCCWRWPGSGRSASPTTVDFAGAEYFALVGATGAGKSTVIDALTFALYGSVPRWDNSRTVALALAPTVSRGIVRLVFDVGGERYVAARELRRAATGSVSVRSARLERLRDAAGLGGADEETDPVADGAAAVTKAVEDLLGLPFGDFCTCVVLPQGDFAEFLHTEPRKRQEKLVRILGLGVYDVIAREANSEAAAQRQRAEVLSEQLGGYADATEAAERDAAARVTELDALAQRVVVAGPELATATADLAAADALAARLQAEREQLTALSVPGGLADLHARQRSAVTDRERVAERAAAAETADTAARERLAGAPSRGPLEQARRDHAEMAGLTAELPGARERHEKASATYATAVRDAADARAALDAARATRDTAEAALTAAQDAVRRLAGERQALVAVAVPAGLEALERRRSAALDALETAGSALADAEACDAEARAVLTAAPERGPLEQARRDRRDLDLAVREHHAADERVAAAAREVAAAAGLVTETRHRLEHTQAERSGRGPGGGGRHTPPRARRRTRLPCL